MELTTNAQRVLRARYLRRDSSGNVIETPEEMLRRVASTVASAEAAYGLKPSGWEDLFFKEMDSLRFLPNTPTLINAGKEDGQLAACFVLPIEDSMKSIFETLKNAALILQSGGGTGFSFSHLRPCSSPVSSTGGVASGPVSFMRIYNTATEVIKQGGARRGANMGILRVDHPDILEFINAKTSGPELENFNISVAITDLFMKSVKMGADYDLLDPRTGSPQGRIGALKVFEAISDSAWKTGDPGLIFIDRINEDNPTPQLGHIESTNPCGEQPLLPYEACVLGSIDVSKFVDGAVLDLDALSGTIRIAVRFLDNCIDVNKYPIEQIEAMHKGNRKIGLGVMGWADALIKMGIPYDSAKALESAEALMGHIRETAREASKEIAGIKGSFPNFKGSVYDIPDGTPIRNATLTTIAPTGSLSLIAGCSSGIEPLFALALQRRVLDTELSETSRLFFDMARENGFYSSQLEQEVTKKGTLAGIKGVPAEIRKLFKVAHDIRPETHIRMQAAFQKYTDNAVSKTVNLPKGARKQDVADTFMLAYDLGTKGITVFRYGSKKEGTLFYNVG
ncbi:adenosylcobalamin-dependent ribonucleoside-diphosphate reductase [Nitrospirota bacterium]